MIFFCHYRIFTAGKKMKGLKLLRRHKMYPFANAIFLKWSDYALL